jgi:hypothetical protein
MKKNYLFLNLFLALLFSVSLKMSGQALSGNYTIDQSQAASSTNFTSFNALATALNTNGISGNVNVSVLNGPYNEQVTFNQIVGMGPNARVTINGNNQLLTFNATSGSPWTMRLNGTDYLTVNNLQMSGTNGTYALVCILTNSSNWNTFSTCTFSCNANISSSQAVPFSWSASSTSPTGSGSSSGDNNMVTDCQMFSGYYGISMWGLTSAPYQQNNTVRRCRVQDFYYYGMYIYYHWNSTILQNVIERPTRTNLYYTFMVYAYYAFGTVLDGNILQKPFGMSPTQTSYYVYGLYVYSYASPIPAGASKTIVRNNILRDWKLGYYSYGMLIYYYVDCMHNTVSFDDVASTNNQFIYGIYNYTQSGQENVVKNNLVSMTMGGSATKYAMYINTPGSTQVTGNSVWVGGTGSNYYVGWYNTLATTWAAWQTAGADPGMVSANPNFVNVNTDSHPTNTLLNNMAPPIGITYDQENMVRNPTTPDVGALEFLTPTCTGTPSMTVAGPTYSLCPGETANFAIGNLSSDLGYTYQWQSSGVSQVGPWTSVPSGTSITTSIPNVTATTWMSAIISCTAMGGSSIQAVAQVNVAGTTTNTVPYYENFEGIGLANRLPNCSWAAPNLGGSAKTYVAAASGNLLPNSGTSFASFNNASSGNNYYYTNGIWMDANVTYSASLWYMTDFTGATNWSNMSILYGTTQTTTGLTQIASVSPAVSPFYKSLSNTFMVPTSGMYYVAIRANTPSGSGAPNLVWDDLRIELPCQAGNNSPNLVLSPTSATICSGESVIFNVSGGDTYNWSTGATGPSTTEYPTSSGPISVTGSNTLTSCNTIASAMVTVKPSPNISLFAFPPVVCVGKSTNLQASGAQSYTWNVPGQGSNINVMPTGPTQYIVMGTGVNGCIGSSTINVTVNQPPVVTAVPSNVNVCPQDALTLSGTGAVSYNWVSTNPAINLLGQSVVTNLSSSATFTLTGTDANGCTDTDVFAVAVVECTGLSQLNSNTGISVYPNPSNGYYTVANGSSEAFHVTVSDVTGRVILDENGTTAMQVNISEVAGGVYYMKVETAGASEVIQLIKQ